MVKVSGVDDFDGTVCEAIRKHTDGPQTVAIERNTTPPSRLYEELAVEMLWGVGGDDKANSSSTLVERVKTRTQVSER